MPVSAPALRYADIDDYLGPADNRFFGSGYRRAEYHFGVVAIKTDDEGLEEARSIVTVRYPADWSRKANADDLRPHLSTIDTLVVAAQLCDAHLAVAGGLGWSGRQGARLRKVILRAGNEPQEDLVAMTAIARPRGDPRPQPDGRHVSTFDCQVGLMRARMEIEHEGSVTSHGQGEGGMDELLGPRQRRYYGEGFKATRHTLEDVHVDMAELEAHATAHIEPAGQDQVHDQGIEAAYRPACSIIDTFVLNLQLAQVLLYEMDTVERAKSNTLWMVQTVLRAEKPTTPLTGAALTAHVAIAGKEIVQLRGGTWRSADLEGSCGGVSLRSTFVHEL